MKKIYRILIATLVAVATSFLVLVIGLLLFNAELPRLAAILFITSWGVTYSAIKKTKKELDKKKTVPSEILHENGVVKEKGKVMYGKREGEWDVFNTEGEYIRTDVYEDGDFRYTKGA